MDETMAVTEPEAWEAGAEGEPAVPEAEGQERQDGQAAAEALQQRLVDGFRELTQAMPGAFTTFHDVPEGAVRLAADKGIGLYDALLRYRYEEEQAASAERERARQAAAASAGSLADGGGAPQPEADAFTRAFARALA